MIKILSNWPKELASSLQKSMKSMLKDNKISDDFNISNLLLIIYFITNTYILKKSLYFLYKFNK